MCAPTPERGVPADIVTEPDEAPAAVDRSPPQPDTAAQPDARRKADALVSHPITPSPSMEIVPDSPAFQSLSPLSISGRGSAQALTSGADPSPAVEAAPAQNSDNGAAAADPEACALQRAASSDSDPSTPVAVREALAAVHSLALTAGVVGSEDSTPTGELSLTGSAVPGSGSASDGEGSEAGFSGHKVGQHSPTTVLSGSPSVEAPGSSRGGDGGGSKLSAAAKEWVPPTSGSPAPPSAAADYWHSGAASAAQAGGYWAADGTWVAAEGYDYSAWQGYAAPASSSGGQYSAADDQWGPTVEYNGAEYYPQQGQGYDGADFYDTSAYNYQMAAAYHSQKETEDAAVAVLAMAFPTYSSSALRKVLRKANTDIAAAAEELTTMETEHAAQQKASAAARKPQATGPPAPSLDEDNFPALGAAASPARTPAWAGSSQVKDTVKAAPAEDQSSGSAPKASRDMPATPPRGEAGRKSGGKAGAAAAAAVPWVETGAAVSGAYADARQEARDHARLRNAYFQQATQAYLAGNKALAKELGAKGRTANDAMKRAHASASDRLYSQRNASARHQGGALRTHNGEAMIDLHGQHAAEGVALLRRELGRLRGSGGSSGSKRTAYICVGTGSHTKGANTPARLPAAVEAFLQEKGIAYSEPQRGLLKIAV